MKKGSFLRNRNFIIIAVLVVVAAAILIAALATRPAPSVPANAEQVDFTKPSEAPVQTSEPAAEPENTAEPAVSPAPEAEPETAAAPVRGYVFCSLPASGQYGFIPLPEEGEILYPIHQAFTDGTTFTNILRITPEGFCMESSTCENQDCVGEGFVSFENRTERILQNSVICLPNQVMLELYTAEELEELGFTLVDPAEAAAQDTAETAQAESTETLPQESPAAEQAERTEAAQADETADTAADGDRSPAEG